MADKEKKKVGRPKAFDSPEDMLKTFKAYKEYIKENPFLVKDWVGKDAEKVERPKEKPLTKEGFTNYCEDQGIITDLTDYFENKEGRYKEFIQVCSRIQREIRQDQIEGGMAGLYNPSITQRLNSLVEKSEVTGKDGKDITVPPVIIFKTEGKE